MARVLVTGASGFIGSHAVRRLTSAGHAVVASGRDASRMPVDAGAVATVMADLTSDDLDTLIDGCEVVVHCAALSTPWGLAADFWRANVTATERLLKAAQRQGVRRFIHLGSPSIYFRFRDQLGVGEAFQPPARWITEYARSKWESECRVRTATGPRLQTLVLRPRAVYGEGDRAILPRLLAVAARGWFPLVDGGRALIDITHIDNLIGLIAHCAVADLPGDGRAYNVSNGEPVQVRTLLQMLFAELGHEVRWLPLPRGPALALASLSEHIARLRPGQPEPRLSRYGIGVIGYSQTLDISRARHELDYLPHVDIPAGLARFARWWEAQGHG